MIFRAVILRRAPEARLEGCTAGPSPFEGRFAATSG
jgi:hypothetical protein